RSPQNELERRGIVELLIGDPALGLAWDLAAIRLTEWAEREPAAGLPHYLLGKNLYNHAHVQQAANELDRALAGKLDAPRVRREALRMRLISACALSDIPGATYALSELRADPELSTARRGSVEHLARRCGLH